MPVFKVSRRTLLQTLGGGAVIAGASGLWLGISKIQGARWRNSVVRESAFTPSVFLAIDQTGDVVIWCSRSEMGQGVSTALPMLVAEELDADWSRVRVEQATLEASYDYGQFFTAASSSVASLWIELRRAGAVAREMLLGAAAEAWSVAADECETDTGRVIHRPSGRSLSYGELAQSAMRQWAPLRPRLKSPGEFRLLGKPIPRVDLHDKATGTAIFGLDVCLPDMVRAVIARPPAWGSRMVALDDRSARAMPGVRDILILPQGVAVVADSTYQAISARNRLQIDWQTTTGSEVSKETIAAAVSAALSADAAAVARSSGDFSNAVPDSSDTTAAEFSTAYVAHACMEPMNCTAWVTDDACELWVPTQAAEGARALASQMTGLPEKAIRVHVTQLGGGFGRRGAQDFVGEAVAIAMKLTQPVQIIWSREDDFRHSPCREATGHRLEAALSKISGLPTHWHHRVVTTSMDVPDPGFVNFGAVMGAQDLPYQIPNLKVEWRAAFAPVPTTIWRSVGHGYNIFAIECFLDQLSELVQADPLNYRQRLLPQDSPLQTCLTRVAALARWSDRLAEGRSLGLACYNFGSSSAAMVAEVAAADESGSTNFRVTRIWCTVHCGIVINPDTVAAQIEGGIVFGLGAALTNQLTFSGGGFKEGNFHEYPLPRIEDMPEISVELIASRSPPSGVGELGVPGVAPAIANALHALSGRRFRHLPLGGGYDP